MQRIAVVGTSCSGKTTFARRLAEQLSAPHIELDALHWGPNWTERPDTEFRASVDEATSPAAWISDGNYSIVRDIVWTRADTLIWLNYPFTTVFGRALWRTFRRSLTREKLYSDNVESLRKAFLTHDSILLWVLQAYRRNRREFPRLFAAEEFGHLEVLEFRSPGEAEGFLQSHLQVESIRHPGCQA